MSKTRLYYIDNLRIALISLVVLHHLIITYGAPGGWYYNESQADFPTVIPMAMFVASNQAFFMGMFFFVSAFFIVPSLARKGTKVFIRERLIRLGIPMVIFYFLLSPFTVFILNKFINKQEETFLMYLKNGWGMGFGPMWFVEALLIFTAIYLLVRLLKKKIRINYPSSLKVGLTAFLIGFLQFLIRIWLPVGSGHDFTNFQFPFFLQYIVLFVFGIIAYHNNWMEKINSQEGWRWFTFAQILIFIGFPALFILGGATESGTEKFMGGFTWQCFSYSIWEQLVGFSLIFGLLGIFKKHFNIQGNFAKQLSGGAYGVYVFHPPILVAISAIFLNMNLPQLLKFVVLAPVALFACFLCAWLVKKLPALSKVF